MSKLVSGKCPGYGVSIDLPSELRSTLCAYCENKIDVIFDTALDAITDPFSIFGKFKKK